MIPIIMDCDPGHDDAIALLMAFASDAFDIKGVTITGGNQTLAKTLNNARKVLSFAGKTARIAAGSDKPILRELEVAPQVHGETGLDGPVLPESDLPVEPMHAIELMKEICDQSPESVTLIATGPLTNVGTFLSIYPECKANIKQIAIMGGSMIGGNWTSSAEFNILVDPEAADIVFSSGIPIIMAGLDVTHKALIYEEDVERIRAIGKKVSTMVAELLDFFMKFHKSMGYHGAPLHDACAVAYLLKPEIFIGQDYYVEIETKGEFTTGSTVVDQFNRYKKKANTKVLLDLDRQAFVDLLVDLVNHYA